MITNVKVKVRGLVVETHKNATKRDILDLGWVIPTIQVQFTFLFAIDPNVMPMF